MFIAIEAERKESARNRRRMSVCDICTWCRLSTILRSLMKPSRIYCRPCLVCLWRSCLQRAGYYSIIRTKSNEIFPAFLLFSFFLEKLQAAFVAVEACRANGLLNSIFFIGPASVNCVKRPNNLFIYPYVFLLNLQLAHLVWKYFHWLFAIIQTVKDRLSL